MSLPLGVAVLAFFCTLCGGFFALRFKDRLHLVLGFSAGAVIGVAFFDLLPEALSLSQNNVSTITSITALGFVVYLLLDRALFFHFHVEEEEHSRHRGILGAASLSFHSFLDGVAIGLAFQASTAVGLIVTAAVLVHDFSDGINTVNLILKNKGTSSRARSWLFLDAIAPVLGVVSTFFYQVSEENLAYLLAVFCGFFLYIGASDLLPESHHHHHKTIWTTFMTVLGVLVLYLVIRAANL